MSTKEALDGPLDWATRDPKLSKVIVYDTGGTILSSSGYSRLDNLEYRIGQTPQSLLDAVPEVLDIAQIAFVELFERRPSERLSSENFLQIARHFAEHSSGADSEVVAGLVLHGTNALSETMFGLDLTLTGPKPLVSAVAMRPQAALSSDAYLNFYQAVSTAISPLSAGRGALVVANDHITSAYYGTKVHASNPAFFQTPEQGHLGFLLAGQPSYYFAPALPTGRRTFQLDEVKTPLPKVDILYSHLDFDGTSITFAVENGAHREITLHAETGGKAMWRGEGTSGSWAKVIGTARGGLVIVGAGGGYLNESGTKAANRAVEQGVPVVIAARAHMGIAAPSLHPDNTIKSGHLSAEHARIQLQLCLATGLDIQGIREAFEGVLRRAVLDRAAFYHRES